MLIEIPFVAKMKARQMILKKEKKFDGRFLRYGYKIASSKFISEADAKKILELHKDILRIRDKREQKNTQKLLGGSIFVYYLINKLKKHKEAKKQSNKFKLKEVA